MSSDIPGPLAFARPPVHLISVTGNDRAAPLRGRSLLACPSSIRTQSPGPGPGRTSGHSAPRGKPARSSRVPPACALQPGDGRADSGSARALGAASAVGCFQVASGGTLSLQGRPSFQQAIPPGPLHSARHCLGRLGASGARPGRRQPEAFACSLGRTATARTELPARLAHFLLESGTTSSAPERQQGGSM